MLGHQSTAIPLKPTVLDTDNQGMIESKTFPLELFQALEAKRAEFMAKAVEVRTVSELADLWKQRAEWMSRPDVEPWVRELPHNWEARMKDPSDLLDEERKSLASHFFGIWFGPNWCQEFAVLHGEVHALDRVN